MCLPLKAAAPRYFLSSYTPHRISCSTGCAPANREDKILNFRLPGRAEGKGSGPENGNRRYKTRHNAAWLLKGEYRMAGIDVRRIRTGRQQKSRQLFSRSFDIQPPHGQRTLISKLAAISSTATTTAPHLHRTHAHTPACAASAALPSSCADGWKA